MNDLLRQPGGFDGLCAQLEPVVIEVLGKPRNGRHPPFSAVVGPTSGGL
jgi:hypothetical protein